MMVGPIKNKESGSLPHSSVLSDSGTAGDFYGNKMNLVGEFTQDRGIEEFEPLVLTDFRNAGSRPYRKETTTSCGMITKLFEKPYRVLKHHHNMLCLLNLRIAKKVLDKLTKIAYISSRD